MSARFLPWRWWALGALLLGLEGALFLALSHRFALSVTMAERPVALFVILQTLAGFVYLAAVHSVVRGTGRAPSFRLILAVGIGMRAAAFVSTPILEDDFNRYLWDGAVTGAGLNPYRFGPGDALEGRVSLPRRLLVESLSSDSVLRRINHPELTTIYPPVSQAVFALAHVLEPFRLEALKGLYVLFDIAAALLLRRLLMDLSLPASALLIYWWNPLFVKETFNSAHMDVLLVPLLVASVLLRLKGRTAAAAVPLALATGVKLWPALLVPLLLVPRFALSRKALGAVALYVALTSAILAPMAVLANHPSAGVMAYAARWSKNGAFFSLLTDAAGWGRQGARVALALILAGLSFLLARTVTEDPRDLLRKVGTIPAAMLLLGPTAFPWYFAWLLPFLVFTPSILLALTLTLPLYYVSFPLENSGQGALFDHVVVFLEWAPIWAALIWEVCRRPALPRGAA